MFLSREIWRLERPLAPRRNVELPCQRCEHDDWNILQTIRWQTTTNPGHRRLSRIHLPTIYLSNQKHIRNYVPPSTRTLWHSETRHSSQAITKPCDPKWSKRATLRQPTLNLTMEDLKQQSFDVFSICGWTKMRRFFPCSITFTAPTQDAWHPLKLGLSTLENDSEDLIPWVPWFSLSLSLWILVASIYW